MNVMKLKPLLVRVACLICFLIAPTSGICPTTCSCGKWKSGKETSDCSFKDFRKVPEGIPPTTQVFHLTGNNIALLPDFTFFNKSLVNLQRLYLSKCHIEQIRPNAFAQLSNLIELDLSDNDLTDIPGQAFSGTPALRQLKMRGNSISLISANAFIYTPSIVSLDISDSKVNRVAPEAFQALSLLETLDLANNKLKELPAKMLNGLSSIHNLAIQGNPWACNCRALLPLWRLLRRLKVNLPALHSCEYPIKLDNSRPFDDSTETEFGCPPEIIPGNRFKESTEGYNSSLSCEFLGDPPPFVDWYHEGVRTVKPTENQLHKRTESADNRGTDRVLSTLIIRDIEMSDAGSWRCEAYSLAGKISANLTFDVKPRPKVIGGITSAHIAGITAGILILIIIIIAVILVCGRNSSRPSPSSPIKERKDSPSSVVVCASPNPIQKPPRLTELASSNSTDPDLISHLGNGYPATTSASAVLPGDYTRVEGDSLYPSGIWEEQNKTATNDQSLHEHFNPGYIHSDSPRHGPNHSTPCRTDKQVDPKDFGYPSDYGLPIPELEQPLELLCSPQGRVASPISNQNNLYDSRQELALYHSSSDIYNVKSSASHQQENLSPMYEMMEIGSPKHDILPSHLNLHDSGHQDSSPGVQEDPTFKGNVTDGSDSASIVTSSADHSWPSAAGGGARQTGVPMGIPVLPPLPNGTLHRIKPRDSPDEGYQEGTEV